MRDATGFDNEQLFTVMKGLGFEPLSGFRTLHRGSANRSPGGEVPDGARMTQRQLLGDQSRPSIAITTAGPPSVASASSALV
jgi:hypothetical protein